MKLDYGAAYAALTGALATLFLIAAVIVKRFHSNDEGRARIASRVKLVVILVVIGVLYFGLFDHTPYGTECKKSVSPDGHYIAERCLLTWVPGGESEYVGRLYDAKSGKMIAQRTFSTPVPQTSWSSGVNYSLVPDSSLRYIGPSVAFSIGDANGGDSGISLPPSFLDRLPAARPRL